MLHDSYSSSFVMKLLADRFATRCTSALGLEPLTASQCRVMDRLKRMGGGPVSQRDLERDLGVSHTTIKGILQRMEEKGLVRTCFDHADKRIKNVYFTEESLRLMPTVDDLLEKLENQLFAGFSDEECQLLRGMLFRMYDNLD